MLLKTLAVAACLWAPVDTDTYLFARYERAEKVDNHGPYGWKDEAAAARRQMTLKEYVIGGLEPRFKKSLRRAFEMMELRGISAVINSGYRGQERQRMVAGSKNPVNRTYHGGTLLPHGEALAVDLMGPWASTEDERIALAKPVHDFIDRWGSNFAIGRPFPHRDPPHTTPTWSREYTANRAGAHTQSARRRHTFPARVTQRVPYVGEIH